MTSGSNQCQSLPASGPSARRRAFDKSPGMIQQTRMSTTLVLGSASPRRAELMRRLGVEFAVRASDVPEIPAAGECAVDFTRRVAREKAVAVGRLCEGAWVLAADTVVVIDGEMLGKPADAGDARRMLRRLSGRQHRVVSGVVLVGPDGTARDEMVVESAVEFRPLSEDDIDAYVASGEPSDRAGAYAIQGGGGRFVRRVNGSYDNVVGLPLEEVRRLLERHGLLRSVSVRHV